MLRLQWIAGERVAVDRQLVFGFAGIVGHFVIFDGWSGVGVVAVILRLADTCDGFAQICATARCLSDCTVGER